MQLINDTLHTARVQKIDTVISAFPVAAVAAAEPFHTLAASAFHTWAAAAAAAAEDKLASHNQVVVVAEADTLASQPESANVHCNLGHRDNPCHQAVCTGQDDSAPWAKEHTATTTCPWTFDG